MKRALPVKIKYIYVQGKESEEKLRKMYFRLFNLARAKLIEDQKRSKN